MINSKHTFTIFFRMFGRQLRVGPFVGWCCVVHVRRWCKLTFVMFCVRPNQSIVTAARQTSKAPTSNCKSQNQPLQSFPSTFAMHRKLPHAGIFSRWRSQDRISLEPSARMAELDGGNWMNELQRLAKLKFKSVRSYPGVRVTSKGRIRKGKT